MIEQIREQMINRALRCNVLPRYALLGRAERLEAERLGYPPGSVICTHLSPSYKRMGLLVSILPVDADSFLEVV